MAPKNKRNLSLGVSEVPIFDGHMKYFTAQNSPYLRPQSPTEKSQITISDSKKILHVCPRPMDRFQNNFTEMYPG